MAYDKPFHRNYRAMMDAPNAGYSSWAYIRDRAYAKAPEHYIRAFTLIQNDLQQIFEFVEPSEQSLTTYSYRIHALLMRTCIEVEANFKAIFDENIFTHPARPLNMKDYRKVDVTHHLSDYQVMLPIWNGSPRIWQPFESWKAARGVSNAQGTSLSWYQAYNASKHDRQEAFKNANIENLIMAVSGLLVLLSSQFCDQDFSTGSESLSIEGYEYHPMEAAIGSLFRIKYPTDWSNDERYDFNWADLKEKTDRFSKINYDEIPS